MADRLVNKIRETKSLASDAGLDLCRAPLLATFEMPIWGAALQAHGIAELAREPGADAAVMTIDSLPAARRMVQGAGASNLHVIAERGLVCGLSGGAELFVYPQSTAEQRAFSVALFAGVAPAGMRVALNGYRSSGRQEVTIEGPSDAPGPPARELLHAVREQGGNAAFSSELEDAIVIADDPAELDALRAALAADHPGRPVRVKRLPSGRFRLQPSDQARAVDRQELYVLAQEIAISCDRFLEARGGTTFGFATEPVAKWEYGPEVGARRLAAELFQAPDCVITQLGLHPFAGEGTLFFAYEGSETVWEAANKGIACITVRDIVEYGRILHAIRRGE